MKKSFLKLLAMLNLEDYEDVIDGKLIEVQVDQNARTWYLTIELNKPLEIGVFKQFQTALDQLPSVLENTSNIDYQIEYEIQDYTHLKAYYFHVLEALINRRPRFQSIRDFDVEVSANTVKVVCPSDGTFVEDLLFEIEENLRVIGFDATLSMRLCDKSPTIAERIEQINEDYQDEEYSEEEKEQPKRFVSYRDRTVNKIKHTISDIPVDEPSIIEYKSMHHKADFSIEGVVSSVDVRKINANTTLLTFVLSDDEDSIYVKKFVRDKEELVFLEATQMGMHMKVRGEAQYDQFVDEVTLTAQALERTTDVIQKEQRLDLAENRRVELHLHSKMSTLDGIDSIKDYVKAASRFKHKAIALTDHNCVQAFPEFYQATKASKVKPIYGVELSVVDEESVRLAFGDYQGNLDDATFTIFDIETTGLSVNYDKIIEISAIKMKHGQEIERFDTFVNPLQKLTSFTTRLTGITDADVRDALTIDVVLPKFKAFIEGTILVAHNAMFDVSHIVHHLKALELYTHDYPVIDTLQIARQCYNDLKRFNLKAVAKRFNVELKQHHRAIYDTRATADIFNAMLADFMKQDIKTFDDLKNIKDKIRGFNPYQNAMEHHVTVLVKNQTGLKNLFKLVSLANTTYFEKDARVPLKVLQKHREGLLVGSGCMNSLFFEIALNQETSRLTEKAKLYDYIEISPYDDYLFLERDMENVDGRIKDTLKRIIEVGEKTGVPVVVTGDVHHIDEASAKFRDIYIRTPIVGGGYHKLAKYDRIPSQYYRTTEEMLTMFSFLDETKREEIVITNTHKINDQIEHVKAFKPELYAPTDDFLASRNIPSIEKRMNQMVFERAHSLYGNPLPPLVHDRLKKEMDSITKNKFSTVYYISHLLVKKSLDEGYLVGSRGSVGSSLVATFMDITEVNPLPPHYVCPKCHFSSFKMSPEEKEHYGVRDDERVYQAVLDDIFSGFDLKASDCPKCHAAMVKDGHDIPFETFLGFKGDKVPDIDLNFSGDYQGKVHEYIRELFGKDRAFRAGTISTVADKTAFGYVKGYLEKKHISLRKAEIERRAKVIAGVKRSTGQHPGGIVVVPNYKDIYDVTPIQYPANDTQASWQTTHFDYHSFEDNLFKLDVLGHDDPTMIRYLMDFVQDDPISFPFSDARDIPLDDAKVYQMLSGTEVIGLKPRDINSEVASFGVPEMGTSFVRGMLRDSRPKTFADIVKVSGLSHGTDVWLNNAEILVTGKNPQYGKIPFSEVIGCRDDIMVYLIQSGLKSEVAFEISEFIRKGKAAGAPEKWESYANIMRSHSIPEWYIWSAGQIKYMFPKAHATAYVMMALRIAWFKLYRPLYFYSAYFSKRASAFDLIAMQGGEYAIEKRMNEIDQEGNKASEKDKSVYTVLEVALEMVKRGFSFAPININDSHATDFVINQEKQSLRLPFIALDGCGLNASLSVIEAREEKPFTSREDVKERTKLSTTLIKKLEALDAFGDLPETSQMNLFDL